MVRAKKFLGQHFLNDQGIAQRIVDSLQSEDHANVLEIGPGTGVLTKFLVQQKNITLKVIEIDPTQRMADIERSNNKLNIPW